MKLGGVQKESSSCALGECPLTIHERDAGKTLHYNVATRFSVLLDARRDPPANLRCLPEGVVRATTGVQEAEPPLYATRFETLSPGTCSLRGNAFLLTVVVGS
jgi:hypothetical protein